MKCGTAFSKDVRQDLFLRRGTPTKLTDASLAGKRRISAHSDPFCGRTRQVGRNRPAGKNLEDRSAPIYGVKLQNKSLAILIGSG